MAILYGTGDGSIAPASRSPLMRRQAFFAASVLALVATVAIAIAVSAGSHNTPTTLIGFGFDSNMPVQWDSDAAPDLDGLSRYYSSPSANMQGKLKARTVQLAQVPSRMFKLGQDSDWDMKHWSSKHYKTVASNGVDKDSVKGIWHSKDEAWAGIDELFPTTDDPYAYQSQHAGRGEEAKMEAFLEHAHHQLALLKNRVPAEATDKEDAKQIETLNKVLASGEKALETVEEHVTKELAAAGAPLPILHSVAAAAPKADPPAFHYETAEQSQAEMASYFDSLAKATHSENTHDAQRAGVIPSSSSSSSSAKLHPVAGAQSLHAGGSPALEEERRMAMGRAFALQMRSALEAVPEGASESCSLCITIFGCADCCQPVCEEEDKPTAAPPSSPPSSSSAAAALRAQAAEITSVEQRVAALSHALARIKPSMTQKGARVPCDCKTAECKECPDHDFGGASGGKQGVRAPCDCKTAECKECPQHEYDQESALKKEQAKDRKALVNAQAAVTTATAVLRKRQALLSSVTAPTAQQLGVYGEQSDDAVWPAREPFPGKSEQIAGGATKTMQDLSKQLTGARRQVALLRKQLKAAQEGEVHEAKVAAEQQHQLDALKGAIAARAQYEGKGKAMGLVLPFYEQPGYGGRKLVKQVHNFDEAVAEGVAPKY